MHKFQSYVPQILKLISNASQELSHISTISNKNFPFIAGGAIANIINYIEHGVPPVINDVDFFKVASERKPQSSDITYSDLRHFHLDSHKPSNSLLNFITLYPKHVVSLKPTKEDIINLIINDFDLSCCQVLLDRSTNTLYFTKHFETFINTRSIYVTGLSAPSSTAIRLVNKCNDLHSSTNFNAEMLLLSQPFICANFNMPAPTTEQLKLPNLTTLLSELCALDKGTHLKDRFVNRALSPLGCSYVIGPSKLENNKQAINRVSEYFYIYHNNSDPAYLIPKRRFILPEFKKVKNSEDLTMAQQLYLSRHFPLQSEII